MRLIQFVDRNHGRRVGVPCSDARSVRVLCGFTSVYELARESLRLSESIESIVSRDISDELTDYDEIITEKRLLPPLDHPDPARCLVTLTGLTHLGSARSLDEMHANATLPTTDSRRMFEIGLTGGKPSPGRIGAQPEWAFKGDGRCIVAPEHPLTSPSFAEDGGEEGEIVGLYVIDDLGCPWRVGFAIGNEFSDHLVEERNYLYLAHSKLRQCSFGPEVFIGPLPDTIRGTVRILREGQVLWESTFESGESNMCHSIGNLEHHHFKYELFRRPGDVHVHFFGANSVSFANKVRTRDQDVFEINVLLFGRPLRNALHVAKMDTLIQVRPL